MIDKKLEEAGQIEVKASRLKPDVIPRLQGINDSAAEMTKYKSALAEYCGYARSGASLRTEAKKLFDENRPHCESLRDDMAKVAYGDDRFSQAMLDPFECAQ